MFKLVKKILLKRIATVLRFVLDVEKWEFSRTNYMAEPVLIPIKTSHAERRTHH